MKTIPLTLGQFALVDDADYEAVSAYKWTAVKKCRTFYAVRNIQKPDGKWTHIYLHRFLMSPGTLEIDHIDGNGLNNQRSNLRLATSRQNKQGHRRKGRGATSKFRGVCWFKLRLKWRARIKVNGKEIHLGLFANEVDAAHIRDAAARKYFGEHAHLNFP